MKKSSQEQELLTKLIEPIHISEPLKNSHYEGSPKLVIGLSIAFMMLFTAYSQCQNLANQLYNQLGYENLGQICVFTAYACFAISNIIASNIKSKISNKVGLVLGGMCYSLLCIAGALASRCYQTENTNGICSKSFIQFFSILSSIILGCGASVLWVSQASFVTECSTKENLGKMNGIFWSICQMSLVLGSTFSTFILGYTSHFTFYIGMLTILGTSLIIFILLSKPPKNDEFQGLSQNQEKTLKQCIASFINTLLIKELQPLFYLMFMNGLYIAFYATAFPKIVGHSLADLDISVQEVNKLTGIAFIFLGLGQIVGGYTIGKVIDSQKARLTIGISCALALFSIIFSYIAYQVESYWLCVAVGFSWGLAEVTCQVLLASLIAADFDGMLDGFTILRSFQSVGVVFGIFVSLVFSGSSFESSLWVFGVLIVIATIGVNKYKSKNK